MMRRASIYDEGTIQHLLHQCGCTRTRSALQTCAYKYLSMICTYSSFARALSGQQVYDLLNALEDRLASSNSAVVLGAIKAFLFLTLPLTATHQQVLLCPLGGGDALHTPLCVICFVCVV
jgi:hypothetical protein